MKYIIKTGFLTLVLAVILSACNKVGPLQLFGSGTPVTLIPSSTEINPAPGDSNKIVAFFTWNDPNYATASSNQKFTLEIDSTGRNFSKEIVTTVVGKPKITFTGQQLNDMLAAFGFTPGQSFTFDIRVTSAYANNNNPLQSNTVTVKISSYLVPITLTPSSSADLTSPRRRAHQRQY